MLWPDRWQSTAPEPAWPSESVSTVSGRAGGGGGAGRGAPGRRDPRGGGGAGRGAPPAVITVPRGDHATFWELDPKGGIGINRAGQRLKLRPFMGIMGMPLDQPGIQSTFPPTRCGGNLDCRELTEGTVLFLPIAVDGGLF